MEDADKNRLAHWRIPGDVAGDMPFLFDRAKSFLGDIPLSANCQSLWEGSRVATRLNRAGLSYLFEQLVTEEKPIVKWEDFQIGSSMFKYGCFVVIGLLRAADARRRDALVLLIA